MIFRFVARISEVTIERKSISRILIRRIIELSQRPVRRTQLSRIPRIGGKLNLSGRVRCQNFVESKVQFLVTKFSDDRRQVNRATVADARLNRHCGQRRNLNRAPGQALDVKP